MPPLSEHTSNVRVVARLDIKGPNVIKGVQFDGLRIMGEPRAMARSYYEDGAQEILFIDSVASLYGRNHLKELIRDSVEEVFIPLTVGGGIRSVRDAREVLAAGADKVAVNTAAVRRPQLLRELASEFGSQCVVVSIQASKQVVGWEVLTEGGRERTDRDCLEWLTEAVDLGAGEALVTSVDNDGTSKGFDYALAAAVDEIIKVPWILSGGFSSLEDLDHVLRVARPEAIAVAKEAHLGRVSFRSIRNHISSGTQV